MKTKYVRLELLTNLWRSAMEAPTSHTPRLVFSEALQRMTNHLRDTEGPLFPRIKIPNVKEFKVEVLSEYHPIFEKEDILKRRYPPIFNLSPYINNRMNRYIKHQFIRLNNSTTNSRLFWRISEFLLNKSSSYAALLMHNVYPQWHRRRSYGSVWWDIKKLRQIDLSKYSYKEVGIPKADGGTRYLGVPNTYWRLYLHGLQQHMQIWLRPYSHPNQHGFQHGKGTDTAWKEIHATVLTSPDIYEYDLKKYFDSINLDYLQSLLERLGIPTSLVTHFINWSRTPAENSTSSRHSWSNTEEEINDFHYHITGTYKSLSGLELIEWTQIKRDSEQQNPLYTRYDYFHGVPQGGSLSPLLSTLPLTKELFLNPNSEYVAYADDGLLYSSSGVLNPDEILQFPKETGIEVHRDKSAWIRKNGEWLRGLKFCGKIYEACSPSEEGDVCQGGTLSNATRSPRPYTFDKYDVIHAAASYDWWYDGKPGKYPYSFDEWFHTKYFGYVTSRIYNGTFDLTDIIQDFTYSFRTWSWSDLECTRRRVFTDKDNYRLNGIKDTTTLTVFNSSSYASLSLCQRIHYQLPGKPITGFLH